MEIKGSVESIGQEIQDTGSIKSSSGHKNTVLSLYAVIRAPSVSPTLTTSEFVLLALKIKKKKNAVY